MRRIGILAVVAAVAAQAAMPAGAGPAPQRMLDEPEARAYAAVGRLNVAGNRHCTATLIAERLALTAAHCLFNLMTGQRAAASEIRFVAGQRRDEYAALRGAVATATLPGYRYHPGQEPPPWAIALDLALVQLDAPVTAAEAAPFATGALMRGPEHWIVGYGQERAHAASIREDCTVMGIDPRVAALDCTVTSGVSGAPVFAEGAAGPEVVAVVSAMTRGDRRSGGMALVVPVADALATLTGALEADAAALAPAP